MSLNVLISKPKNISKWVQYKNDDDVLAEFKVRGIGYKSYQVAVERAQNQIATNGFNVDDASPENKLFHELLLDAAACHLIEDWKGVVFLEDGKEKEVPYTTENAKKLLTMGDIGSVIWAFVKNEADKMQREADEYKNDILGKLSNSTSGQSTETTEQQMEA